MDRARFAGLAETEGAHYILSRRLASTASRRAGCSPTSTKTPARFRSSKAIRSIPASRGRNCAKGPATLNQINDPDRILYPLKRTGKRGEGKWEQVSWDQALDDIASRIRKAIVEDRRQEIMYHVGRPGEDGFTERILAAWGVDGHNSHTNICSSGSREGYQLWMGLDRPSPDHANAKVILLISAHLESGHYFNPHAQRVIDGKANGAKLIVFDTRLSNTATHADHFICAVSRIGSCDSFGDCELPDSEQSLQSRVCRGGGGTGRNISSRGSRSRSSRSQTRCELGQPASFAVDECLRRLRAASLKQLYADYTFEFAANESGVDAKAIEEIAKLVSTAGTRFSQSQLAQRLFGRQRWLAGGACLFHA